MYTFAVLTRRPRYFDNTRRIIQDAVKATFKGKQCWHLSRSIRGFEVCTYIFYIKILFRTVMRVTSNLPFLIVRVNIGFISQIFVQIV